MEFIILGKHSDEKGTELEKLTRKILKNLGYSDVSISEISSGGFELDVTAEFTQPGIGQNTKRLTICECKAHRAPVSTQDWMKFLGKIFTHELGGKHVDGCFIALNGANGNVKGQYRALREKRQDITLITGDDLLKILDVLYHPMSIDEIQAKVATLTTRKLLSTSLCYYQDALFWLLAFVDGCYSLLTGVGGNIESDLSASIQGIVTSTLDISNYVELEEEMKLRERHLVAGKYIISVFLMHGKRLSIDQLISACNAPQSRFPAYPFEKNEIENAVKELISDEILDFSRKTYQLRVFKKEHNQDDVVKMYRWFLKDIFVKVAIGCKNYQAFINQKFLEKFAEIQGNLIIPPENRESWIKILQLSPSALRWAIYPDDYLLEHRGKMPSTVDLDHSDVAYVSQSLANIFTKDFVSEGLRDCFYESGALEIDTQQVLKIKNTERVFAQIDYKERILLLPFGDHKQIVPIRVLPNVPETWETQVPTVD